MTFPEMDLYHGGGKDVLELDVGGKAVSWKQIKNRNGNSS